MSEAILPSLLLLPPPPVPATAASLEAAYKPSLQATITLLSSLHLRRRIVLQIVVPCSELCGHLQEARSHLFQETQHLLAGIYRLIAGILTIHSIDPDEAGGVDARVLLLAHDINKPIAVDRSDSTSPKTAELAIVSLPLFASARHKWHTIFLVEGEQGEEIFRQYVSLLGDVRLVGNKHTVAGGVSMVVEQPKIDKMQRESSPAHKVVAVGGTFDHLHAGHKLLLTATALLLQPKEKESSDPGRLIIGITGDQLLKNKKYAEHLQSWKQRHDEVMDFLLCLLHFSPRSASDDIQVRNFDEPVVNGKAIHTYIKPASVVIECVEIQDPFGPTITDETVSALAISAETRSGGKTVNDKREEKGWAPLEVFEIDVLDNDDMSKSAGQSGNFDAKLSSTAIRKRKAESGRSSSL